MANKLHRLVKIEVYIYEVFQFTLFIKFWLYIWDCEELT